MDYPPKFPKWLRPRLDAELLKLRHKFSQADKLENRIKETIAVFAKIACEAVERGDWRVDLAHSGLKNFAVQVCADYTDRIRVWPSNERKIMIRTLVEKVVNSKEWLEYVERLADFDRTENSGSEPGSVQRTTEKRNAVLLPILNERGMSRSRWATKAGVDPSVVYDYLSGKSVLRADSRKALAEVLGLKAFELPE